MTQSQRTYWCSKGQSMLSESFERWQSACSKWFFQPLCVNYSETVWDHIQEQVPGLIPLTNTWDWSRIVQSSRMTKTVTVWCPVKADFKQEQNTKPSSEKQQQRKSKTKPRVYAPIRTSKQIRYNLPFRKCTVCIVQDKVVKAKLSGPVRLWDFWVGGTQFDNDRVASCTQTSSHHLRRKREHTWSSTNKALVWVWVHAELIRSYYFSVSR